MAKLSFPDISQQVHDQLITYARSYKVERRLNLRAQIILDWRNGLTYKESSKKTGLLKASLVNGANDLPAMGLKHWQTPLVPANPLGLPKQTVIK